MTRKQAMAEKARGWIESNAVIIDTETTGLDERAEVVEIAAIDCRGDVLLDQLVCPIPPAAAAIHGITRQHVLGKLGWGLVGIRFLEVINRRPVVIYNADYDRRILRQTAALFDLPDPLDAAASVECAMLAYAEYRQIWNPGTGDYRWHKLTNAAAFEGVDMSGIRAHRALGDCLMTLGVIRAIAAYE